MTEAPRPVAADSSPGPAGPDHLLAQSRLRIARFRALSREGFYALAAFLALTAASLVLSKFLPDLPSRVVARLGPAPPVKWINAALIVYTFSALVLTLTRFTSKTEGFRGWPHLLYLTGFYAFYFLAQALGENFWAIFLAGLTVLVLESYRLSLFCAEAISREEESVERIRRQFGRRGP